MDDTTDIESKSDIDITSIDTFNQIGGSGTDESDSDHKSDNGKSDDGKSDDDDDDTNNLHSDNEDGDEDDDGGLIGVDEMPEIKRVRPGKPSQYATKYEVTRALAVRASQISHGAPPAVDVGDITDVGAIAQKELDERKIPIIIERPFPDGTVMRVKLKDLIITF
jgi:DNA-directed RNA polymerase subunit K/omega